MTGIAAVLACGQAKYIVTAITGASGIVAPAGFTLVTMEAIGGGGSGYRNSTAGNRASGGGGAYAKTAGVTIDRATPGTTDKIWYSVGGVATSSWVRQGTNSAPSSTTDGCLAYLGTSGASATPGVGGTTANSIGVVEFAGVNGATNVAGSQAGGAAGGDGGAGSGTTGGGSGGMKGGNGGAVGAAGVAPGGGAGSGSSSGTYAGTSGKIRIIFHN